MARKLGHEQSAFRAKVKSQFGCALEFLSKDQASGLIDTLNRHLKGNGHVAPADAAITWDRGLRR